MSAFDRAQAAGIVQSQMGTMLAHAAHMVPFIVNGTTYTHEQIMPMLVIDPASLDVHAAQVAGWIGHWGILTAAAKRAHDKYQATYRGQRDSFIINAAAGEPAEDGDEEGAGKKKATKGKSKTAAEAEWRSKPGYAEIYDKIADLEYAWSCAQFVYEALTRKSNMLTALGKLYADERSALK